MGIGIRDSIATGLDVPVRRQKHSKHPSEEISELKRLGHRSRRAEGVITNSERRKWGEGIRTEVVNGIRAKRAASIEDGILFLEVNPRYDRSGYYKEWVARALKSAPLTRTQQERLRRVILKAIESERVGPEFTEYTRLAIVVADADFIRNIKSRPNSPRGWVQKRVNRLRARLEQFCPHL